MVFNGLALCDWLGIKSSGLKVMPKVQDGKYVFNSDEPAMSKINMLVPFAMYP